MLRLLTLLFIYSVVFLTSNTIYLYSIICGSMAIMLGIVVPFSLQIKLIHQQNGSQLTILVYLTLIVAVLLIASLNILTFK